MWTWECCWHFWASVSNLYSGDKIPLFSWTAFYFFRLKILESFSFSKIQVNHCIFKLQSQFLSHMSIKATYSFKQVPWAPFPHLSPKQHQLSPFPDMKIKGQTKLLIWIRHFCKRQKAFNKYLYTTKNDINNSSAWLSIQLSCGRYFSGAINQKRKKKLVCPPKPIHPNGRYLNVNHESFILMKVTVNVGKWDWHSHTLIFSIIFLESH